MERTITAQTRNIDKDILAVVRRQLGRNFVSLVCVGSRAYGDDLPDSDYDGFCYVRDYKSAKKLNLSAVEKRHGVRIGIAVRSIGDFVKCVETPSDEVHYPNHRMRLLELKLGHARVVGGRNLSRKLPPLSKLLPADWKRGAQIDYWSAVLDMPTNVRRREPRRHVGFIIAICSALLTAKGLAAKKNDLPKAMRRHHPKFRVIDLLRRALRRRAVWPRIENDRRELKNARKDLEKFLKIFRDYVFAGDDTDATPEDARRYRALILRQLKF